MITKLIMPKLGETMEEGAITKWMKKEGEKIEKGEPIFEVTTDKATFEVESPVSGLVRKILFQSDSDKQIPVIRTIGYIADSMDEEIPAEKHEVKKVAAGFIPAPAASGITENPVPAHPGEEVAAGFMPAQQEKRIKSSPLAKKIAGEKRIDLSRIKGTGPNGRITEKDVLKFVGAGLPAHPSVSTPRLTVGQAFIEPKEVIPLSGIRKTIARRLSQSKHDAPHYYLQIEIDMTEAVELREKKNKSFSYNDMIIKSVAKSLEKFPMLNAAFREEKITVYNEINIGIAIASPEGLVVPVIKNANKLKIEQVAKISKQIKDKSETNKFTPGDFSGGTFTISNLGMYGIDIFTAIINPPQVGILAVGAIKEKPVVLKGKIVVRPVLKVSLSADHRVIDGVYAAGFLGHLKEILQKPYPVFAERRQRTS